MTSLRQRNPDELKTASEGFPTLFTSNRQKALEKYSASPEGAPFQEFYQKKLADNGAVLKIYKGEADEAAVAQFYETSANHWKSIVGYLLNDLPQLLPESGFIGGAEPGEVGLGFPDRARA